MECRPPRGGRGLKFQSVELWLNYTLGRPPCGGRGLKYGYLRIAAVGARSPSPRRAWIEIQFRNAEDIQHEVALPAEARIEMKKDDTGHQADSPD